MRGATRRIYLLRKANSCEVKHYGEKARQGRAETLEATDWKALDAMTDSDIARQIASDRDAAPDTAQELDVRADPAVPQAWLRPNSPPPISSASGQSGNGSAVRIGSRALPSERSCARSRLIPKDR